MPRWSSTVWEYTGRDAGLGQREVWRDFERAARLLWSLVGGMGYLKQAEMKAAQKHCRAEVQERNGGREQTESC